MSVGRSTSNQGLVKCYKCVQFPLKLRIDSTISPFQAVSLNIYSEIYQKHKTYNIPRYIHVHVFSQISATVWPEEEYSGTIGPAGVYDGSILISFSSDGSVRDDGFHLKLKVLDNSEQLFLTCTIHEHAIPSRNLTRIDIMFLNVGFDFDSCDGYSAESSQDSDSGVSAGAIVGIVLASAFIFVITIIACVIVAVRSKHHNQVRRRGAANVYATNTSAVISGAPPVSSVPPPMTVPPPYDNAVYMSSPADVQLGANPVNPTAPPSYEVLFGKDSDASVSEQQNSNEQTGVQQNTD